MGNPKERFFCDDVSSCGHCNFDWVFIYFRVSPLLWDYTCMSSLVFDWEFLHVLFCEHCFCYLAWYYPFLCLVWTLNYAWKIMNLSALVVESMVPFLCFSWQNLDQTWRSQVEIQTSCGYFLLPCQAKAIGQHIFM